VKPIQVALALSALLAAVVAAGLFASSPDRATAEHAHIGCGNENWPLKTLSDPERKLVDLRPTRTSVSEINHRPMPGRTPRTRTTPFARQVWRVRAQITEYKLSRDGEVYLVLYDGRKSYMTAGMPSTECLPGTTRARKAIESARALLEGLCGPALPQWRPLGAVVLIDGVGYWNVPHDQHGHALNYAELHPVTRVQLIDGCA